MIATQNEQTMIAQVLQPFASSGVIRPELFDELKLFLKKGSDAFKNDTGTYVPELVSKQEAAAHCKRSPKWFLDFAKKKRLQKYAMADSQQSQKLYDLNEVIEALKVKDAS